MLYELVQQSGVSKSEWVLRPPSKFQTRLDFFPWVKRIPLSNNVFPYPSHLLLGARGNPLSQSSPCCEWTETMLCLSGRGLGSHWPQCVQGCLRAVWLWWRPSAGLGLLQSSWESLCLEILINIGNSWSNWCKTSCEQCGGQICYIAEFWERLLTGKDYSKQQCMCVVCGVMQKKTPTPVASSPLLSAGAEEVWPLACAAVPLCLQKSGREQ